MEKFLCRCTCTCGKRMEWSGRWETLCIENELETIRITGNGRSFEVILGISERGDFVCIPAHGIGFELEEVTDSVYVEEQLSRSLEVKDAVTIATWLLQGKRERGSSYGKPTGNCQKQ